MAPQAAAIRDDDMEAFLGSCEVNNAITRQNF